MNRGDSLADDLKAIINSERYSDITIKCSDFTTTGKMLYATRTILAARSEVFDRLLYNGMKESNESEITFPVITTAAMKAVLEFIYTGELVPKSLNTENAIETFLAANYFLLPKLEKAIVSYVEKLLKSEDNDQAAQLLSKAMEKMGTIGDNRLYKLLSTHIVATPLDSIGYDNVTSEMLQVLLSQTLDGEEYFATTEYSVFRYVTLWAAKKISQSAFQAFEPLLPNKDSIDQFIELPERPDRYKVINDYHEAMVEIMTPILAFINLRLIPTPVLANIVHPLDLASSDRLLDAYQYQGRGKGPKKTQRGGPSSCFVWDTIAAGRQLNVTEDGRLVSAPPILTVHQSVRATYPLPETGTHEWDIIIEETCSAAWVGLCGGDSVDLDVFLGAQESTWIFGSSGYYYDNALMQIYGSNFGQGARVTFSVNMSQHTCSIEVNGNKEMVVWRNLPDRLYPAASLRYPGRFRIQPHT